MNNGNHSVARESGEWAMPWEDKPEPVVVRGRLTERDARALCESLNLRAPVARYVVLAPNGGVKNVR